MTEYSKRKDYILRGQFKINRELFIDYMQKANFETYNYMMDIIKSLDPDLYNSKISNDKEQIQNKIMDAFVNLAEGTDAKMKQDIKSYLAGEAEGRRLRTPSGAVLHASHVASVILREGCNDSRGRRNQAD